MTQSAVARRLRRGPASGVTGLTRHVPAQPERADVAVDERLLEILVCPDCRGEVEYKDRRKVIVCQSCGLQYPVT